ncbi:MAG: nucleoside phosphorylase, partial [Candidatus Fimadaptatus sp.]|nr:nucleoside phosphorylase [Candidatus Fimadaptatus sp.]
MSIVDSFDAQSSAMFSPCDVYRPLEGFPEIALIAFNRRMVDFAAGQPGAREITKLHYAVYEIPVYALKWQGRDIAVCVSFEGSGGAAMVMEELIALGARAFLAIGSCGCLDAGIAEGHLIVPTAAYRDEGASYHYVAASDFVDVPSADGLARALDEMGLKYTRTRTWTTDAPYRETRENVRRRAGQGCGVVEMECAGLA